MTHVYISEASLLFFGSPSVCSDSSTGHADIWGCHQLKHHGSFNSACLSARPTPIPWWRLQRRIGALSNFRAQPTPGTAPLYFYDISTKPSGQSGKQSTSLGVMSLLPCSYFCIRMATMKSTHWRFRLGPFVDRWSEARSDLLRTR